MTNADVKAIIDAFNSGSFRSYFSLRPLTNTVSLGFIWTDRPMGRYACESSRKVYFIHGDSNSQCVGIVVEMGFAHSGNPCEEENLHWYVLEDHRGKGHLHSALHDCILPHIFSDGREFHRITADSKDNADYLARQGFTRLDEFEFRIEKTSVKELSEQFGMNSPLTKDDVDQLKARLREAKALVKSVHEELYCHFGHDSLNLDHLAQCIEDEACCIGILDKHGKIR